MDAYSIPLAALIVTIGSLLFTIITKKYGKSNGNGNKYMTKEMCVFNHTALEKMLDLQLQPLVDRLDRIEKRLP